MLRHSLKQNFSLIQKITILIKDQEVDLALTCCILDPTLLISGSMQSAPGSPNKPAPTTRISSEVWVLKYWDFDGGFWVWQQVTHSVIPESKT